MYRKITKSEVEKIKHGGFKSLVKRALELGIKVEVSKHDDKLRKFSYKGEKLYCRGGNVPVFKRMGDMTKNKQLTKNILEDYGLKVPKGILVKSYKEAEEGIKMNKMTYPLIVKPLDGTVARGVTWNINSKRELSDAVKVFKKSQERYNFDKNFLVEKMAIGDEYRVLVFKGKIVSCVKKVPASLEGDGKHTISELIKIFDETRIKGFEIKKDDIFEKTLKRNKMTLETILEKGFVLKLRNNLNMSDGGRSIDCSARMSKYFKKVCEDAARVLGLTYGGVDLITDDISKKHGDYVILEANPNPYYNMNEKPLVEGKGIDFSKMILNQFFPRI